MGDCTFGTSGRSDNGCWQYGWLPDLSDPASSFTMDDVISMTWGGITGFSGHYSPEGNAIVLGNLTKPQVTIVQGTATCPVDMLVSGPCGADGTQYGALRFIVPVSGPYDITGTFEGLDTENTTVDVHVIHVTAADGASESLFRGYVDGYYGGDAGAPTGPTPVVTFSHKNVLLAAGDSLLFAMGDGGNGYYNDTTGLSVHIGASTSVAADNPFGYLGGLGYWQDPALSTGAGAGLSYVRQRWLENGTGQWLSVDPVPTESRYAYAGNSPTMRVDPHGTQATPASSGGSTNSRQPVPPSLLSRPLRRPTATQPHTSTTAFATEFWDMVHAVTGWFSSESARAEHWRRSLPPWLRNIAPPPSGGLDGLHYEWGYFVGFHEAAIAMVPKIGAAELIYGIFQYLKYLQDNHIWSQFFTRILDYAEESMVPIFQRLDSEDDIAPQDRGELLGIIVGSALVLLVFALSLAEGLVDLAPAAGYSLTQVGKALGTLSPRAMDALHDLAGCKFEKVTFATAHGRLVQAYRLVNRESLPRSVSDLAKNPEIRQINPESIKIKVEELAKKAFSATKLPKLPKLPKIKFAIVQELTRVVKLARINLHGLLIEPIFLSEGLPEGVNAANVANEIKDGHAVFTVSTTSFKAYIILDDEFFDLSRPEQRVRIGHEAAHGQQYAEILGKYVGPTAEKAATFLDSGGGLTGLQQAAFSAAKELNAQRVAFRALFPDLPSGALITAELAASEGLTDAFAKFDTKYKNAQIYFDVMKASGTSLPQNLQDLDFMRDLFR